MNIRFAPLLALSLCASGCIARPPRDAAPQLSTRVSLTASPAAAAPWPQQQWWLHYNDLTLNELMARALRQSPDLAVARGRFEVASSNVRLASAAAGLRVDASMQATRQRLSDNGLFPPEFLGFNWYNSADLGIDMRYTFDWWGRQAAQVRAAVAQTRAAEAEAHAAELALTGAIAEVYFGWQSDAGRRELAAQRIGAAQRNLDIATSRLRAQLARIDEVEQANRLLLDARDRHNQLGSSQQLRLIALAGLLGVGVEDLPPLMPRPLPAVSTELPADASVNLLGRRPDIVASRWRVEASVQNVTAARAGFMPDFSLRALAALSSIDLGKLLEAGSAAPAFSAAVRLPLFDAGQLRALHQREQANAASAVATYNATVLTAAREVNTQLEARRAWTEQLQLRDAQRAAAENLRDRATARADAGLSDARPALAATIEWLSAREAGQLADFARLTADLALVRALGGGYQAETTDE